MLTIDDCNSIIGKYSHAGFWYTLDLTKLSQENTVYFDFIKTSYSSGYYYIKLNNPFFHGLHYFTANGSVHSAKLFETEGQNYDYKFPMNWGVNPDTLHLFFTVDDIGDLSDGFQALQHLFIPKYGLQVPVINGEFNDKFYINVIGTHIGGYVVDDVEVESGTDENGTFIRLPYAEDCIIGVKSDLSGTIFNLYKVTFREFKSLPIVSIPPLYRSTPQKVTLINTDTEEEITEFQAYYNGHKLKDNIITPKGIDDEGKVSIIVDLLDPKYPETTLKLKTTLKSYSCKNNAQVTTALEKGIKTIMLNSSSSTYTFEDITFEDMEIRWRKGYIHNCTFNNCTIVLYSTVTDMGGNTFNNCTIRSRGEVQALILTGEGTVFNNCTLYSARVRDGVLRFTGRIYDSGFRSARIISDGDIEITNCEFKYKCTEKDYFPNFLYLTGDYTVQGNEFLLKDEWVEPSFDMCIIKANSDFNPPTFIANNTFYLEIIYEDEPTDTFYYCIVDDDKIYARRLS